MSGAVTRNLCVSWPQLGKVIRPWEVTLADDYKKTQKMGLQQKCAVGAGMPDVERLTRKLERRKASLSDLCQLYRASSKLPLIQNALLDHPGPNAHLLKARYALHMAGHLSNYSSPLSRSC